MPTTYDNTTGTLTIRYTPVQPVIWFAYFPPYAAYRLEDKLLLMSHVGDAALGGLCEFSNAVCTV